MENQNDLLIIKDILLEDFYYVCVKRSYFNEDERAIIAHGETKEKALISALEKTLESHSKCMKALNIIGKTISHNGFFDLSGELDIPSQEIHPPGGEEEAFSKVIFNKEANQWWRLLEFFCVKSS